MVVTFLTARRQPLLGIKLFLKAPTVLTISLRMKILIVPSQMKNLMEQMDMEELIISKRLQNDLPAETEERT